MRRLIGIKSSLNPEELKNKIFDGLKLLEIYLSESDFHDIVELEKKIKRILMINPNLKLMLHCPWISTLKDSSALSDESSIQYIEVMYKISKINKNIIGFVQHIEYTNNFNDLKNFSENLEYLRKKFNGIEKYMYLENIPGNLSKKNVDFLKLTKKFKLKKICFDFAHFTAFHSRVETIRFLELIEREVEDVYFHISDNNYKSSNFKPKNIGDGEIDFEDYENLIRFGIVETYSDDEKQGYEMKKDYKKLKSILKF